MRRLLMAAVLPLIFVIFAQAAPASAAVSSFTPSPAAVATFVPAGHQVRARLGDTLSSIAARVLGSPRRWPILWWDNRSHLPNPDALRRGQVIHYGPWHRVRPWLRHAADAALPKPAPARTAAVPAAASAAPASTTVGTSGFGSFETCVIERESGGNPQAYNPASGAGGLFQFLPSTWASLGYASAYPGGAQTAPARVQEAAFAKLYAEAGTAPWSPYDGC